MNIYDRHFVFSSDLFSSYKVVGDIRYFDSLDNIMEYCVDNLLKTLKKHNFISLIEECKQCHFHIHTHTFDDILVTNSGTIIYICEGCNEEVESQ